MTKLWAKMALVLRHWRWGRVSCENPLQKAVVAKTGLLETVVENRPGFTGHLKHLKNDASGA